MRTNRRWLKAIRQSLNKTHLDVAGQVGIERAYYTMIENGTRSPSPNVAKQIALVLGFDWTLFFEDDEAGPQSA